MPLMIKEREGALLQTDVWDFPFQTFLGEKGEEKILDK